MNGCSNLGGFVLPSSPHFPQLWRQEFRLPHHKFSNIKSLRSTVSFFPHNLELRLSVPTVAQACPMFLLPQFHNLSLILFKPFLSILKPHLLSFSTAFSITILSKLTSHFHFVKFSTRTPFSLSSSHFFFFFFKAIIGVHGS